MADTLIQTPQRSAASSRRHHSTSKAPPSPFSYRPPPVSFRTPTKTPTAFRRGYLTSVGKHQISYSSPSTRSTSYMQRTGSSPITSVRRRLNGDVASCDGDRFIPSRRNMNIGLCRRKLLQDDESGPNRKKKRTNGNRNRSRNNSNTDDSDDSDDDRTGKANDGANVTPIEKEFHRRMVSTLCDVPLDQLDENGNPRNMLSFGPRPRPSRETRATLRSNAPFHQNMLRVLQAFDQAEPGVSASLAAASISDTTINRKLPTAPSRVLDAPELVDDFYLNLISWGKNNILAVALSQAVYLWDASSGEIHHLTDIDELDEYVTSVSWCEMPGSDKYLSIGTNSGSVELWDTLAMRKVRTLQAHTGRVSSLAWSHQWLSSGGRDSQIVQHDVRSSQDIVNVYQGHEQEVCGLSWNEDGSTLASGGNENAVCIWDASMTGSSRRESMSSTNARRQTVNEMTPRLVLDGADGHKAAVKALGWCPHRRGMLASGGGTADRTIKLWNTQSGAMLQSQDTGSQVCSLLWSRHQRELCSAHGFSEHQLTLWKFGSGGNGVSQLNKVTDFRGHTSRVLSLACSPDGGTVVSAAGDETLRFWDIFGAPRDRKGGSGSSQRSGVLSPGGNLTFGMPTIR